jgi:CheY-like chemotaxis protein
MSEQDDSTVRLLSYHELMLTLQGLCREKRSGVMVISNESGGTAQLTLDQGEIFDCVFAGMNGKTALLQIKKIIRGKATFFKRDQGIAIQRIDLPTDEILQILTASTPDIPENTPSIQAQVSSEEHLSVIEAHLATIVGPIARIIYQEYCEEIQQTHELDKLNSVIEKIAKQVLLLEKQTLFQQNIHDFISKTGLKDRQVIVNTLKSTNKEPGLHPVTLSLFINKFAAQGELSTSFLTKLATQIEQAGNLAGIVKLFDILRFLEKTTKTGVLSIGVDDKKAGFYFNQGALINAFEGNRHGVSVAMDILQWQPEQINFIGMAPANVAREIHQTVEVLLKSLPTGIISKEEALKYTRTTDKTANEIQAALSKEIERLQGKVSDKKEDAKSSETELLTALAKAIQLAETYDHIGAESILAQILFTYDQNYDAWFWLAKVLTSMTAIEFALKKAAHINSKSSELADEVKKFTIARKLLQSDFVLRCPFCRMPVKEKDHECSHCLANFYIDSSFFTKVGKAKIDILDKAIARYDNALQRHTNDSNNVYLLFYLAMAYLNRQYYQEGLAQLNEIAKLAPDNRALLKQGVLLNKYMQSVGLLSNAVQPVPATSTTTAKILVVEDSVVTRKVITRTLVAHGYEVFEAKNAEEALTDIVERNPDLVLLDIMLPGGKDGYDILAEIRQNRPIAKVPVVMLTSRDSLFDKIKGKVSDANEYLTKPFQPDELMQVVKKYLK